MPHSWRTNSLGAALGLDPVPSSGSVVDDEAVLDQVDSTFWTISNVMESSGPWWTGPSTMVCMLEWSQRLGFCPHEFVSVDAVVPAHAGVGFNGRFAVLAEVDSDDEATPEVRARRRRDASSPSFPPTEAQKLTWSLHPNPARRRRRWNPSFLQFPKAKWGQMWKSMWCHRPMLRQLR